MTVFEWLVIIWLVYNGISTALIQMERFVKMEDKTAFHAMLIIVSFVIIIVWRIAIVYYLIF